jgi:hypothetical protein
MDGYFIEGDGTVRELLPGANHSICAKKWYRCKLDTAIKRGIVRVRFFDAIGKKTFCIESGKNLTSKQKKAIMDNIPAGVECLVWCIAGKNGDAFTDIAKTLFNAIGV